MASSSKIVPSAMRPDPAVPAWGAPDEALCSAVVRAGVERAPFFAQTST
jgi:hypothetical protein